MAIMVYALPVLPGQEARARDFERELRAHWDEMLELNRAADLRRWSVANQETPMGMLQIHVFEAHDLSRMGRAFTDSDYDRWWLGYLEQVCGLDRATVMSTKPPAIVFDWQAP